MDPDVEFTEPVDDESSVQESLTDEYLSLYTTNNNDAS